MRGPGLALLFAVLAAATGRAADDPCHVPDAPRVVAVGDVHGAYDGFLTILRFAGIVDAKGRWAGGKAHLVQTGDVLDRGKDARKVLDLLMRLESEARKAGGRVHALLGNHEVMNMLGDLRYLIPEEYKAYVTPDSERYREAFLRSATERAKAQAKERGEPFDEAAYRAKLLEQVPLGFIERTRALSAEGQYGKWLRQRPVVAKVNGVVFVHGGLTPEVAALGCEAINATVHRELTDDIAKTREAPLATLAAGENGPLWYRGLAKEDETSFLPSLEHVLQSLQARAIVVGHTPDGSGRIRSRFGGRAFLIDAGMTESYGGHLAALEVGTDGTFAALYPDRREDLVKPAAAARVLPAFAPGLYSNRLAYASR